MFLVGDSGSLIGYSEWMTANACVRMAGLASNQNDQCRGPSKVKIVISRVEWFEKFTVCQSADLSLKRDRVRVLVADQ